MIGNWLLLAVFSAVGDLVGLGFAAQSLPKIVHVVQMGASGGMFSPHEGHLI